MLRLCGLYGHHIRSMRKEPWYCRSAGFRECHGLLGHPDAYWPVRLLEHSTTRALPKPVLGDRIDRLPITNDRPEAVRENPTISMPRARSQRGSEPSRQRIARLQTGQYLRSGSVLRLGQGAIWPVLPFHGGRGGPSSVATIREPLGQPNQGGLEVQRSTQATLGPLFTKSRHGLLDRMRQAIGTRRKYARSGGRGGNNASPLDGIAWSVDIC